MICIRITEREDGLELSAHGHAGYAPRGQDVVCAGVSALIYGFIAYLEGLLPIATEKTPREGMPRLETPRLETPRLETPQLETPRLETPQLETPRLETPRLETPQLEVEDKDDVLRVRTYGMRGADTAGSAVLRAGLGLIASAYPSFVMLDAHIHRKGDEYESN